MLSQDVHCSYGLAWQICLQGCMQWSSVDWRYAAAGGAYINEQPLKAFRDAVVKNLQTRFSDDTARFLGVCKLFKNLQTRFSDDTARFLGVCKLFNKSWPESSFTDDYVRSVVANVAPVDVSDAKVIEDRACNCSVLPQMTQPRKN